MLYKLSSLGGLGQVSTDVNTDAWSDQFNQFCNFSMQINIIIIEVVCNIIWHELSVTALGPGLFLQQIYSFAQQIRQINL